MAKKIIGGILDGLENGLENGVIRPQGYTTVEPIMADLITSPPRALTGRALTGKEFINRINNFFNKIDTLEEYHSLMDMQDDHVADITTRKCDMADGGECYLIWARGIIRNYNFLYHSDEYFTKNLLFFVNKVKDENGIMRWRIVDKLEENGLPSPYSAFNQACNNGDF